MIFSDEISFALAFLLVIGVGYLIYKLDNRVKKQGHLFTKPASPKTRGFALLVAVLLSGFVVVDWVSGLRVYWPLLFISIPLIVYSLGFEQPLMAVQSWKVPKVQLPQNTLLRNGFRLILMFPRAMVFAALGGISGAMLGMVVGSVVGWEIFLCVGIGTIIVGVGLVIDFIERMGLHFAYGVIYGIVSGVLLGGAVALSYGEVWIVIGLIVGIVGSSIGVVLHKQKSINNPVRPS